jgi:isopentenyl phosphate kinase
LQREPLILKIGGSVITDKERPLTIDRESIEAIAQEISEAYREGLRKIVLIHGGGSYGHYVVRNLISSRGEIDEDGFSEVTWWMGELNRELVMRLRGRGLPAVSISTHSIFYERSDGSLGYHLEPIVMMIERELIPVLYGDAIVSGKTRYSILSGDTIAWRLSLELGCKRVLFATNVDGVFDRDPSKPGARLLKELRISSDIVSLDDSSSKYDVTGGMRKKILEGLEPLRRGVRALIFNGRKKGNIYRALKGYEDVGTVVIY